MLHSLNALHNYHVSAPDGDIGYCKDFLFNDEQWNLHYMLVDTHKWIPGGKKVLLHCNAVEAIDVEAKTIKINLTREQIKASPSLLANEPISRAYEKTYMCYFDYATYHVGPSPVDSYFAGIHPEQVKLAGAPKEPASEKNHVHSAHFIEDYDLQATDKKHGHIVDFILNEETWDIELLAVELGNWFMHSKPVLLPPSELGKISWPKQKVYIELDAEHIKAYPLYKQSKLPSVKSEVLLNAS